MVVAESLPSKIRTRFGAEVATLVDECSDDKSASKVERKKQQISHAAAVSEQGKLIKNADKLSNLKGLLTSQPKGWNQARVQGYFAWSFFVVHGCRGGNARLEKELDEVFMDDVRTPSGKTYPALPTSHSGTVPLQIGNNPLEDQGWIEALDAYYSLIAKAND